MSAVIRDFVIMVVVLTGLAVVAYFLLPDRMDFVALPLVGYCWSVGVLSGLLARLLLEQ